MITAAEAHKLVTDAPKKLIEELEEPIKEMASWGSTELNLPQDNGAWPTEYLLQEAETDSDNWKTAKKALEDLGYVVEYNKSSDDFDEANIVIKW